LLGDAVALEEVTIGRAVGLRRPVGGVELAAVACLLCGAFVAEVLELWVEPIGNDSGGVPTGVEVGRVLLGGDEAAVEICRATACGLQRAQRIEKPVKQLSAAVLVA
jgi:hypothetical protein